MGKGDKRTKRGKIYRSSHGNARPHHARQPAPAVKKTAGRRRATRK